MSRPRTTPRPIGPALAYSIDEAALLTSVGKTTLRTLVASGQLPSVLITPRRRVISREVLEAFVAGKLPTVKA